MLKITFPSTDTRVEFESMAEGMWENRRDDSVMGDTATQMELSLWTSFLESLANAPDGESMTIGEQFAPLVTEVLDNCADNIEGASDGIWPNDVKVENATPVAIRLGNAFIPVIEDLLGDTREDVRIEIRYIEDMPIVSGVMYHVVITPRDETRFSVDYPDLDLLGYVDTLLDPLRTDGYEWSQRNAAFDGYDFLLGDGDDSGAVWRETDGTIRVWLRGWK